MSTALILEREKFVAIYVGSAEGLAEWKATDEEKRKEREKAGMEGWMKWAKDNEALIVDLGSPLGKTKRIDAKGVSDTKNEITAYTIVQAESHEAVSLSGRRGHAIELRRALMSLRALGTLPVSPHRNQS
jgi:hypothetical protein